LTTAAPAEPPISAWDELVGRPMYQVKRFQPMAPIRAAKMTGGLTTEMSINPAPTVSATRVWTIRKAAKLKKAAQMTAWRGVRTRVETTVAIEFAASCMPLVKSNASATTTMKMTKRRPASGMRLKWT